MSTTANADRVDTSRAALIVYDACRRALTPADPARRAGMRPVLDAWVALIGACRARAMPVIYTTPVSRADGADIVLLPTDLSAETGAVAHELCRGYARRRLPRRDRATATGLRLPEAPAQRVLWHRSGRALASAPTKRRRDRRWRDQSGRRDQRAGGLQHGPRHRRRARMLLGRRCRGACVPPGQV